MHMGEKVTKTTIIFLLMCHVTRLKIASVLTLPLCIKFRARLKISNSFDNEKGCRPTAGKKLTNCCRLKKACNGQL
jgi:hypothetical protein